MPTEYIGVDIHSFRSATRDIHFDVYLKLSDDNYAHVFSRSAGLDYKRLAQYIAKGAKELYIKAEDQEAYQAFLTLTPEKVLSDPDASQEKKVATLLNLTEQNMAEIFAQLNIADDTASNAQRLMKNYVTLMQQNPRTLALMVQLVSHGEYLYYHSVSVSIFGVLLAKATGLFNQATLEVIGLGGFLHDIGTTQVSKEIVCSATELTVAQWREIRNHPRLGLQLLERASNIPDEVRYIVYQHHEAPNGNGYPNGLHDQAIYYPAKVIAVADAFSALISKRPFRSAYTMEQAVHILETETGKFDRELVRLFSSLFLRQASGQDAA